MNYVPSAAMVNSASIIGLLVVCWLIDMRYARHIKRIDRVLETIRFATYEITTTNREDIEDLRAALQAAGIEQPRVNYRERLRRIALTPEQREAESIARFEEIAAKILQNSWWTDDSAD